LNNKDKIIKRLEKENKKNVITDIIGTKPIKNVQATPIINADNRSAKIKIVSNVIEKFMVLNYPQFKRIFLII